MNKNNNERILIFFVGFLLDPSWVIAIYVTLPLLFIAIIAFVVWKWLMNKKISMDGKTYIYLFLIISVCYFCECSMCLPTE